MWFLFSYQHIRRISTSTFFFFFLPTTITNNPANLGKSWSGTPNQGPSEIHITARSHHRSAPGLATRSSQRRSKPLQIVPLLEFIWRYSGAASGGGQCFCGSVSVDSLRAKTFFWPRQTCCCSHRRSLWSVRFSLSYVHSNRHGRWFVLCSLFTGHFWEGPRSFGLPPSMEHQISWSC